MFNPFPPSFDLCVNAYAMSLLRLHRLSAIWKNWPFGEESEVLADSAVLQVENVSNGEEQLFETVLATTVS